MTPANSMSTLSNAATTPAATDRTMRRIGYALSAVSALFLLMDSAMKLLALPIVLETTAQLGYPSTSALPVALGSVLLVCTALYIYIRAPRFSAQCCLRDISAALSPLTSALKVRCSRTPCSAFISGSFCGAGFFCATGACAPYFHGVARRSVEPDRTHQIFREELS